jgi:quercetin dioxygenase-like cupin family protein
MTKSLLIALAGLAAAAGAAAIPAQPAPPRPAPPAAVTRVDLQRHDLSIAGREAVQSRVDFPPGATAPRHRHPGEEIVFVLRGTLTYRLDGQPPVTLNPGGVLFIPAGAVHAATNTGTVPAAELATYVVEKGRPLVELIR